MTEPARASRSLPELLEASEHLYYELWMLNVTAHVLAMPVCLVKDRSATHSSSLSLFTHGGYFSSSFRISHGRMTC